MFNPVHLKEKFITSLIAGQSMRIPKKLYEYN
jgi:hypothetical protein